MPTLARTAPFIRDFAVLTRDQRAAFKRAVSRFVADLETGSLRPGLRVKGVQDADGIFEMTWADDGRATFEYGPEIREGEPHVIWRRVGTHAIFARP